MTVDEALDKVEQCARELDTPKTWRACKGKPLKNEYLAPAQMVETRRRRDSATYIPTCARDVEWALVSHYRPLTDPEGIPYCSGEGLDPRITYVAKQPDGTVIGLSTKPRIESPLGIGFFWTKGHDGRAMVRFIGDDFRIPGDWRQSLMRVWREG